MRKIRKFELALAFIGAATIAASVVFLVQAFDKDSLDMLKVGEEDRLEEDR